MASKHREWVTYGFENTLSMCINAGIHVDGEMRSVMKEKDCFRLGTARQRRD